MTTAEELFLERYNKLNAEQKEAVDHIYGPVMVIAGPGTGKTEALSMRIANLLRSDAQVQPHEILCLTYTDEATNAMRRRLVQIIGPAAHKVNIYTFHAFCNNVIQNNSEHFSMKSLQPITDLERTEIMYKLLEGLPSGHALRKLSGNIYFDSGKISRLFDTMKREYLASEKISDAIDVYITSLPEREEYIYKKSGKGYQKGDVKQKLVDEETRKMEGVRAAALLFDQYEQMMKDAGRYDFNDMIIWVLDAFKNNAALLQSYQERFQFILVDEFQDTNGSQNELITYLTSYWDDPNVFVVGDDDQGVYEFQGARLRNIADFYERYKETIKIIVLTQNYRSSQRILDKAMKTIDYNEQRLIKQLQELKLNKQIIASAGRFAHPADNMEPVVTGYNNVMTEEADIVMQLERLQQNGVSLANVAVLYAQHKQAANIIALLERKGIPYNVKRPVNVLEEPLVEQLINILKYLDEERKKPFEGESILFELMHSPYFGISPTDIANLALYLQQNRTAAGARKWRLQLADTGSMEAAGIASAGAMTRLSRCLDDWQQQLNTLPIPLLLEKIVYESGIVAYLLGQPDHVWHMQTLNTFFEFVKDAFARNNKLKIAGLLQMIEQMGLEKITLPLQRVIQNEDGVHFYTAHSSKGNEFEYVYLIGCTKNYWEDKRGGNNEYRLPDTITATEDDAQKSNKTEVARRLFFVALTRAKKYLHVSYALNDNAGKAQETSVFIDEISLPEERVEKHLPSEELVNYMAQLIQPVPEVRIQKANANWIDRELQQFTLSATSLTKFLHCPLTFYYENVLKAPFQKNDALAFGSAIHGALERLFLEMKANHGEFPDKEFVIGAFKSGLYAEASCFTPVQFERRMEQGSTLLTDYYDRFINTFHKDVEIELKVNKYLLQGVPITGKIDKLELDGDSCKVIDYKTGDPDKYASAATAPPNDKEPLGGDYWRQMVFYKLLLENYEERRLKVTLGRFDYLQKSKTGDYKQVTVPVYADDEEIVLQQMKESYDRIMRHDFDKGCGKDTCHWCNFATSYKLVRPEGAAAED